MLSRDIGFFCSYLAVVIRKGANPGEGLSLLASSADSARVRAWATRLAAEYAEGVSLATAARRDPELFPTQLVSYLEMGERAGRPEEALERLACLSELKWGLEAKLRGVGVYALCLTFLALVACTIFLVGVVPQLRTIQEPPSTDLGGLLLNVMREPWAVSLVLSGILALSIFAFRKRFSPRLAGLLPGQSRHMLTLVELLETLAMGLSLGESPARTLAALSFAGQPEWTSKLIALERALLENKTLGNELVRLELLPEHLGWYLDRSLEEKRLLEGLRDIREILVGEVRQRILWIQTIVEPAGIVALGVGIGSLLYLCYLPIFQTAIAAGAGP